MDLNYSINAFPFTQFGVVVSTSEGVVDGLALKEPLTVDWPDANGVVANLFRPRFKAREIKLTCFLIAISPADFVAKLNGLITELSRTGTQRLRINPIDGKPLVYEVYSPEGVTVDKRWKQSGKMIGQFVLNLVEPQPVKWVLSGQGGSTVSMTLTAPSPITLHWGDGTKTEVMGTNQTVSHTYGGSLSATYYLIVSGELQTFSYHSSTNLTEIWPRLY